MDFEHVSNHDLEQYHLGMIKDEAELARLVPLLLDRASETADYVDMVRRAAIRIDNQK